MTDIAAALATGALGNHEGSPVLSVGLTMPKAAGGLRDPLNIDPVIWHKGEELLVLVRGKVGRITYDPVKDTDGVMRVHVLDVESATLVEGEVFEEALDAMADRVREAKEAAAGIHKLPWDGDESEALAAAHEAGEHADGLAEGCGACDEERDAMLDEDRIDAERDILASVEEAIAGAAEA